MAQRTAQNLSPESLPPSNRLIIQPPLAINILKNRLTMTTYQELVDFCKRYANNVYVSFPNLEGVDRLPPEIGEMKGLRQVSFSNGNIKSLPPEIGQMNSLEYLQINNMPLEQLPKEIENLQCLNFLRLENLCLKDFSFLAQLPNLATLMLINCQLTAFPTEIQQLKRLNILNLSKNKIKAFPDWFGKLKSLERLLIQDNPLEQINFSEKNLHLRMLNFENCKLVEIPESIGFLTNLNTLMLKKNKLARLPEAVGKLSNLDSLNISKNPLVEFPKNLLGLKKLNYFQFDEHWMNTFPYSLLALGALKKLPKGKSVSPRASEIPNLARVIVRNNYPEDFARFLMDVLAERWEKIERYENYQAYLLDALNCSLSIIQMDILEIINNRYLSDSSTQLNKDSVIAVIGNTGFNLNELRERVNNVGLQYSRKLQKGLTHLVVGRLHKTIASSILELNPTLITEKNLLDYLNQLDTPYLLEESEAVYESSDNTEHLSALLMNPHSENVALALQMLRSGGVPDGLITELALVYFNDYPKKIRDLARKLLEQYGPQNLTPFFSKVSSLPRSILQASDPRKFRLHFEQVCEEFGFNKLKILRYWMGRKMNRWKNAANMVSAFILRFVPEEEGLETLQEHIKEGVLTLENWDLSVVPESLLKHKKLVERIEGIRLANCGLLKFPSFILAYKKLKRLELDVNSIRSIPKEIRQLSDLVFLNLNRNNFKTFPTALTVLNNLEVLIMDNCPLPDLEPELLALKKLKKLTFINNRFEEIPAVLFQMQQLEHLDIRRIYSVGRIPYKEKTIHDLKAVLPNCEIIG